MIPLAIRTIICSLYLQREKSSILGITRLELDLQHTLFKKDIGFWKAMTWQYLLLVKCVDIIHWLIVFGTVIFALGYHHIFPSRLTVRTQHLYIIITENQPFTSRTHSLYEKLQRNRTSSFQSHKHRLTNTSQITTKFNSTFIDKVFVNPVSWIRSNIHKLEYTLQITFEIYYSNEANGQV